MQDYNNGPEIQNSGAMQMARTQTIVDTCWLMLSRLMICNANDSDQKKTRPMSISTFNKLNKDHNPHKKPKKKIRDSKDDAFPQHFLVSNEFIGQALGSRLTVFFLSKMGPSY